MARHERGQAMERSWLVPLGVFWLAMVFFFQAETTVYRALGITMMIAAAVWLIDDLVDRHRKRKDRP